MTDNDKQINIEVNRVLAADAKNAVQFANKGKMEARTVLDEAIATIKSSPSAMEEMR